MGLCMTAADLCSSYKQWEVQRSNVSIIMEEFFQQVIEQPFLSSCFSSLLSLSLAIHRSLIRKQHLLTTHRSLFLKKNSALSPVALRENEILRREKVAADGNIFLSFALTRAFIVLQCSIVCIRVFYASSRRLQSLSMTSADLCAMYKPWPIQQTIVSTIMDEFWEEVCFSILSLLLSSNRSDDKH